MLAKHRRVELRKIRNFFNEASKVRCEGFFIFHKPNSDHLRVSVVVPKKQAALATQRAKIKRYIYQAIQEKLPTIGGWRISMVIVVANPKLIFASENFLEQVLVCLKTTQKLK